MKIIHYINQFYAQIGGEEKADTPLSVRENAMIGPGVALKAAMGDEAEIVATIVCGDNYFNENLDEVTAGVAKALENYKPDIVIAGPAFNAGRYGMACGNILKICSLKGIPAFSGMYPENPGAEMFRTYGFITKTRNSAGSMRSAIADMTALIRKVLTDPRSLDPKADNYIQRGQRINKFSNKTGAERCVEMMLNKVNGRPYETELPMPTYNRVPPAPAIKELSKAVIALVTTGAVVPEGNPDHIETGIATKFGKYSFSKDYGGFHMPRHQMIHGGCDPVYAQEDPNRMIPADVLKDMEAEGKIGKLSDTLFVTSGNGSATNNAVAFGQAIAAELKAMKVDGIILTSA